MNNIEKIRKMSVDELAEFLHGLASCLAVKLNGEYVINETEQIKEWLVKGSTKVSSGEIAKDNEHRCMYCREIIPQGRDVCPICEKKV